MGFISNSKRIITTSPATSCIVAVAVVTTLITMLLPGVHAPEIIATFAIIATLGLIGLIIDPLPFSTCQMVSLFCLLFLGIAPMAQYITGTIFWRITPFNRCDYLTTNLLIIACLSAFLLVAYFRRKKAPPALSTEASSAKISTRWLLAISLIAMAATLWYYRHSPTALLLRSAYQDMRRDDSPMSILLIDYMLRSIPAICLIISLIAKARKINVNIFLALCALVCTFPSAIPRFQLATLGTPMLLSAFPILQRKKAFSLLILLLLLAVFPFLKVFRHDPDNLYAPFLSHDFDCYQNMLLAIDIGFVSYGRQLLGVLLFFVPRALWPDKPIGSGPEMAEIHSISFHDISMPFFGEGYVNFGVVGAIGFAIFLAWALRWLDTHLAHITLRFPCILYLLLLGQTIYLMRGTLMVAVSSFCCYALVAAFVYFPSKKLK